MHLSSVAGMPALFSLSHIGPLLAYNLWLREACCIYLSPLQADLHPVQ